MIKSAVPNNNATGTVVPVRDDSLKISVIKRMVFHHDGQSLLRGIEGWTLGYRPAPEHSFQFQPEIVMNSPGCMLLDDKNETVAFAAL